MSWLANRECSAGGAYSRGAVPHCAKQHIPTENLVILSTRVSRIMTQRRRTCEFCRDSCPVNHTPMASLRTIGLKEKKISPFYCTNHVQAPGRSVSTTRLRY